MESKKIKKKVTGDFKTETKFNEFIGGKGFVNFISNEATIEGKYLSGLSYGDLVFKLKIYEDGTVDFDEIDTNLTSFDERKRLVQVIEDQTLTSYRNRTVINELMFTSVEKVKDQNVPLYLSVDYVKPIEKLTSLFGDDKIEISDDAMDNLNDLLNSWFEDEDFAKQIEEMVNEENIQLAEDNFMEHHDDNSKVVQLQVEDSFSKMKEEKLNELRSKRSKTEQEISKLEYQISTMRKSVEENKSELKLIESRIDDIQPTEPSNGYYFNVSEKQNETVVLEPEIETLIKNKVSQIKSINVDAFMKLFTCGEHKIKISKITESGFNLVENTNDLPDDLQENLSTLDLYFVDGVLTYNGEMSWGELVNKMVKMGFQQNPDFDKFCGSNSYSSKDETKSNLKKDKTTF